MQQQGSIKLDQKNREGKKKKHPMQTTRIHDIG